MLIWKGVVTRKDIEEYVDNKTKEKKQAPRFSIEGTGLVPDKNLNFDDLPEVGTAVEALVNRVFLTEKKRDMFVVLGFVPQAPVGSAAPIDGHYTNGQVQHPAMAMA